MNLLILIEGRIEYEALEPPEASPSLTTVQILPLRIAIVNLT